jgi:predicted enzyme related to lactoylglutathione lyase
MSNYNAVGWFEIYVDDMPRAVQFYEAVFSHTLTALPMPEGSGDMEMMSFPMEENTKGASGALVKMEGFKPGSGGTLIYFSSEDCTTEEAKVEAAGGKVHQAKMSIGQYGFVTLASDTEGNMFGIHSQQ